MKALHTAQPLVEELERAAERARLALDAAISVDHDLHSTGLELEDRRSALQEAALDAQQHANALALWCQPTLAPPVARCDKLVYASASKRMVRVCERPLDEYGDCPDSKSHTDYSADR